MRIKRVEDSKAWQAARDLVELMDRVTDRPEFQKDLSLKRQIRDASVSTLANIAEGFDSGSDREFARFLKISKRSAAEVQSHLYVAKGRRLIPKSEYQSGYDQCEHVKRLNGGWIRYLVKPRKPRPPSSTDRDSRPGSDL
jgi:four helix bundle protein